MVGKGFLVPTLASVVLVLVFRETEVLHFLVWEIVLGRLQGRIFETKKKRDREIYNEPRKQVRVNKIGQSNFIMSF